MLLDLGVDVEELKKERPFLENLVYSPLSSGWSIATLAVGGASTVIALTIFFICCFKGQISCRQNVDTNNISKEKPKYCRHDIIHMGVISPPLVPNNRESRNSKETAPKLQTKIPTERMKIDTQPQTESLVEEVEGEYLVPTLIPRMELSEIVTPAPQQKPQIQIRW